MAFKIRLAAEDRARYDGCPEWLPWNPRRLSIGESIAIEELSGVPVSKWRAALAEPSAVVWKLVVWMSLNRAGLQIGWDDVDDVDWLDLEVAEDEDEVEVDEVGDPGKEPGSTPPPPSGDESTG